MKNRILIILLSITTLISCSKDTESTDNFTDPVTADLKASDYTSDRNFLKLVDNYSGIVEKIWLESDDYKGAANDLNTEDVLQMAGYTKIEEFRAFQEENSKLYNRIVADYDLESKAQLRELSSKLKDKSKDKLLERYPAMKNCVLTLVGCLVDVLVSFAEGISEVGGVGCEWNPGSDCWDEMLALEATAMSDMVGCLISYFGC